MKNLKIKVQEKRKYNSPFLKLIILDHEISLVLESEPPKGPSEISKAPEYFNKDPFKTNVV